MLGSGLADAARAVGPAFGEDFVGGVGSVVVGVDDGRIDFRLHAVGRVFVAGVGTAVVYYFVF